MAVPYQTTQDSIRRYLQSIGRIPLLTHEQEVEYGQMVQAAIRLYDLKAQLSNSLGHDPSPSDWEIAAQLSMAEVEARLERGKLAKQKMVQANLRLVVSIAKKYVKSDGDLLDLVQEGTIGLQRGIEKFDPAKGYRLSTYSYWWIRQGITRAIAQKSRTIRLPTHMGEKLRKLKRVQRQLHQHLGRTANVQELAIELKITPQQVYDYFALMQQPISLDLRVGDNGETALSDMLEDHEHTPDNFVTQRSLKSDLERIIHLLPPRQQQIIRLRYGLDGGEAMTLTQIGNTLDISRERVRQLEREGLTGLRKLGSQFQAYLVS